MLEEEMKHADKHTHTLEERGGGNLHSIFFSNI